MRSLGCEGQAGVLRLLGVGLLVLGSSPRPLLGLRSGPRWSAMQRRGRSAKRTLLAGPTTTLHAESNQQNHDSSDANDVRYPSKRTGRVTGVRPDQTNNRPDDQQTDHRGKPVGNPSCGDAWSVLSY